ncbi:MAG TPA: LemA family protein [archaeon]|nr:LemA family protein [archaeon]
MANNTLIAIGAVVVVLLLVGIWAGATFNNFVALEQNIEGKQADLEAQYQRRVDLIPNVVNTVKGVAGFEQETLTELTQLRSQWQTQPEARIDTANQIESALSKLIIISENYPELQATQAYRDLIIELEGTENRVAFARTEYNNAVREYNTAIKKFPGNFISGMFGFSEKKYFEANTGAENAPTVDFGK